MTKARLSMLGASLVALAALLAGACSTRLGDPKSRSAAGRPCDSDRDCPAAESSCQVWTCFQGLCASVDAARETVLPRDEQTLGDCKLLVCDGEGRATALADPADVPPEDDNPCAEEVCESGAPAFPPVEVGSPCGEEGVCNGKGKCGVCLPEAKRCTGNTPETCGEEGEWASEGPCSAPTPVCLGDDCTGVPEVVAGDEYTCALFDDGTARCFGSRILGRLGEKGARRVPGLSGVRNVVAGGSHTCALLQDGTVSCWGDNTYSQLGDATKGTRSFPSPVPGLTSVKELTAGALFTCALLQDGTAVCWGDNEHGQLGTPPVPPKPVPQVLIATGSGDIDPPRAVSGLSGAIHLSLGSRHACALLDGDTVSCWGSDDSGQLGRGSPEPVKPPAIPPRRTPVRGLKGIRAIAAGAEHACALLEGGSVSCWGRNQHGQLGDGTPKKRTAPVKVAGLPPAKGLGLGGAHTCALLENREVMCWGERGVASPADPTGADVLAPEVVEDLTGAEVLTSGPRHACASFGDRSHVCWGRNAEGQLGSDSPGTAPAAITW
ncbi:MAG: hypothetical protein R3B70_29215 [Polyangiaceae bacterium]